MNYQPIWVEESLHKRTKVIATHLDLSMRELATQALEAFLPALEKQHQDEIVQAAKNEEEQKERARVAAEEHKKKLADIQKNVFGDSLERQKAANAARLKEHGGIK